MYEVLNLLFYINKGSFLVMFLYFKIVEGLIIWILFLWNIEFIVYFFFRIEGVKLFIFDKNGNLSWVLMGFD